MIFRKLLSFIASIYIFLFVACSKGDSGNAGPAGASGAAGPTGRQGPKGDTGASTVIYSNWIPITAASWKMDSMKIDKTAFKEVTEIDTLIYYHVSIPTPKITKAMLDKGLVQFYIKDSTNYMKGVVNLFTGSSYIRVGVTNHRFLPAYQEGFIGMGNNSFVIHLPTFGLRPDSMVMVTSWFGSSQVYDPYSIVKPQPPLSDIITYSELPPRTQFYIRYIIIPGGIPDGRQSVVDVANYAAVKAHYHLPD